MSSEDLPQGAIDGAELPQRQPGRRLQWFGTLPPVVPTAVPQRRGDAVTVIRAQRQRRAQAGEQPR